MDGIQASMIVRQLGKHSEISYLLPERENSSIGNAPWDKKKLFYRTLVAKTEVEREKAITLAEQQGLTFGNRDACVN